MRVFYFGYPGGMGGANVEMLHTAAVWLAAGIDVTFIPTWGEDSAMESRLTALGCETLHVKPEEVERIADLPGSICMSMCNAHFWKVYPTLKKLGCKTVWSGAMTFEFPETVNAFREHGLPDVHHFQSKFQQEEVTRALAPIGKPNGFLIRGAFNFNEIPYNFRRHDANTDFVIGRLSRPDPDKWSGNHWPILARVPYTKRKAFAMGWTQATQRKCGPPPPWATVLEPQKIPVSDFLGRCHAMLGLNGGARENWPRIGLEAMAAGVPLVCQNLWGWREMIVNGETGFLTESDEEMVYRLAQLAYDDELRRYMIAEARDHLEELADPERIGRQWTELFASLGAENLEAAA